MKRLHLMCLAYNQAELVEEAISLCEAQRGGYPAFSKTLYNPRYPLAKEPEHSMRLIACAMNHGWEYVEIENGGVAQNWAQAIAYKKLTAGDVLVGIDPDERPQEFGWVPALMDVFNNAPECYYVGLNQEGIQGGTVKEIGTTKVLDYPHLIAWPIGGFDIGWLNKIGGIQQDHAVYGYIEHNVSRRASAMGGRFYMLRDFYDLHLQSTDAKYQEWKSACAAHKTKLTLDGWLNAQR